MKRILALWCLIILLTISGCAQIPAALQQLRSEVVAAITPTEPAPTAAPTAPPTEPLTEPPTVPPTECEPTQPPDYVTSLIQSMSLREKVGQLFIVHPDSLVAPPDDPEDCIKAFTPELAEGLKKYPVGGFVMFSENITSPTQITVFNESLQANSAIPLFLCVDEEGGLVARLANHKAFDLPKYRNAATVGKSGNPDKALEMGRTIGAYLNEYGFNTNFAPVADVNTNAKNTVIGTRAFSPNPETAAKMASAMAEGLREQGIIATFKHFPGHGDTAEDSHDALAVSKKTAEELAACEWIPFRSATENDFVMMGHIALPVFHGNRTPASMSREVVTGILREQLGFEGLVITDSLEMGAVTALYDSGEAALTALQAGCDILLMPANLPAAFESIVEAVENGQYSQEQLDATLERILRFKERHGMLGIG